MSARSADSQRRQALLRQLQWRSRRGSLELDLLLLPFARQQLPQLDDKSLQLYGRLLECSDRQLRLWLQHKQDADLDPSLRPIVERIRR